MRRLYCLIPAVLCCGLVWGADWLTDGGDPQRTAWQRDEKILTKDNVKNLKVLWKLKLDNEPRQMHSLFPPLIVGKIETRQGPKQIAIVAGVSDNIYGIDVDAGTVLWKKHFEYTLPARGRLYTLCPGGQTATPVIGPPDAAGARTVYVLAGDGQLHFLNVADGEEVQPPVKFGWPNGKPYALNLWNNVIYTTTAQGCGGNPNQVWALDLNTPDKKVSVFHPRSGGLWGRTGAAISSDGVVYAPTGDGEFHPEDQVYGNGIIGVKLEGGELKLKDYFAPTNWEWLRKRDLDMNVTPAIFKYKGRELMVTSSKECRIWLMDTKAIGGEDHQTPLYRTPLMCNEEVNFAAAGVWGAMATWEDSKGTRWILSPFHGPVHPQFKPPITHGPVTHGAVVAFKLEEKSGKLELAPAWMSRDMNHADPPLIANGVVYAYGSGESAIQATAEEGLPAGSSENRIKWSTHAVLYALDAETGKELYSSEDQITSFSHFSGLSIANGRVYIGTYDSNVYCFGIPESLDRPATAFRP